MTTIREDEVIIKLQSKLKKGQETDLKNYLASIFGVNSSSIQLKVNKRWVLVTASSIHNYFKKEPCPDCDGGWMPPPPPPSGPLGPRIPDYELFRNSIGFVNKNIIFNGVQVSTYDLIIA